MAFLFSVFAVGSTGGLFAGFRDEAIPLSLSSLAFSEVSSVTAIFIKHIFQTVPAEMK